MSSTVAVWSEDRLARMGLAAVCEAGSARLGQLLQQYEPAEIWAGLRRPTVSSTWAARAREVEVEELAERTDRLGMRFVTAADPEWAPQLGDLNQISWGGMSGEPVGLWVKGPRRLLDACRASIAIVGSRASTSYGNGHARAIAFAVADARPGWTVISGGAYGIDASAHRGAVRAAGGTIAVLAGGVDELYPRGNHELLSRIAAEHLLVGEMAPGSRPTRASFLARNRLIAALSRGTVIVEAAIRSGALNTANWATELARPVMALPGPVDSALSSTPNRLIRDQQAVLVADGQQVLITVAPAGNPDLPTPHGTARPLDTLEAELLAVREMIPHPQGATAQELTRLAGVGMAQCLASLAELEELGLVRVSGEGIWHISS